MELGQWGGGAEARLKGSVDVAAEGKLELWQHVEQVLRQPAFKVQLNPEDLRGMLRLYFDGGCQTLDGSKQGAGGFIAWGADG